MKRILIAVAALFMIAGSAVYANDVAENQNVKFDVYEKYKDEANVSAMYISPLMLSLLSGGIELDGEGVVSGNMGDTTVDLGEMSLPVSLLAKLKGMYVIATEDPGLVERIVQDVDVSGYSELMTVKDGGDRVGFFYKSEDNVHISEFLMTACSDGEIVVMKLESNSLTMQDIMAFAQNMQ